MSIYYKFINWRNRLGKEKMTCPRRMRDPGPWEYKENLDYWEKSGINKTCSFCGCMDPDEFIELCKKVIETKGEQGYGVNLSDKRYKIYAHQPNVSNAKEGAIKFYTQHMPLVNESEFIKVVNEALKISREVFNKKIREKV